MDKQYVVIAINNDDLKNICCVGTYDFYCDALGVIMEDIYFKKELKRSWDVFEFTDPCELSDGQCIKLSYKASPTYGDCELMTVTYYILYGIHNDKPVEVTLN